MKNMKNQFNNYKCVKSVFPDVRWWLPNWTDSRYTDRSGHVPRSFPSEACSRSQHRLPSAGTEIAIAIATNLAFDGVPPQIDERVLDACCPRSQFWASLICHLNSNHVGSSTNESSQREAQQDNHTTRPRPKDHGNVDNSKYIWMVNHLLWELTVRIIFLQYLCVVNIISSCHIDKGKR